MLYKHKSVYIRKALDNNVNIIIRQRDKIDDDTINFKNLVYFGDAYCLFCTFWNSKVHCRIAIQVFINEPRVSTTLFFVSNYN